jgi:hypothetical protein
VQFNGASLVPSCRGLTCAQEARKNGASTKASLARNLEGGMVRVIMIVPENCVTESREKRIPAKLNGLLTWSPNDPNGLGAGNR